MLSRGASIAILCIASNAVAAPATVDSLLCKRTDHRFDGETRTIVSLPRPAAPNASVSDDGTHVHVCSDAAKTACSDVPVKSAFEAGVSPDGKHVVVGSDGSARIVSVPGGKTRAKLTNKRDRGFSCGGGLWLGNDVVLAYGADCSEFDALPFLANSKTGKYIAALGPKLQENGETLYEAAHVDGALWGVAVYEHYDKDSLGTIYVIDTTNGKVAQTVVGTKDMVDKLPSCAN
jgi:hypothetical protein